MKSQRFSIQKLIFEIGSVSEINAHDLQNRVSKLANTNFNVIMEDYFENMIPVNLLIQMDSILLDLGHVDYEAMEQEIQEKFSQALDKAFVSKDYSAKQITQHDAGDLLTSTLAAGNEKLLEYFLLNGILPWWAPANPAFRIQTILTELLKDEPAAIHSILFRFRENDNLIKRLVYQFDKENIYKIVQVIEPQNAAYILKYYQWITKVEQEAYFVKTNAVEFSRSVIIFILKFLIRNKNNIFNKKMFMENGLQHIALRYNLDFSVLLQMLYPLKQFQRTGENIQLKTLFEEIYQVTPVGNTKSILPSHRSDKIPAEILVMLNNMELIEYYLQFNALPATYENIRQDDLKTILIKLAQSFPRVLRNMLKTSNKAKGYYSRLNELAGQKLMNEIYGIENFNAHVEDVQQNDKHSVRLRDVLRFLLKHGSLPWWGRGFSGYSTKAMLEELYETNEESLIALFRQSDSIPQMRDRILGNIPFALSMQVLNKIPYGSVAIENIHRFLALMSNANLLQSCDQEFIQKELLRSALFILSQEAYSSFPVIVFFKEAVLTISVMLKIMPYDLVDTLYMQENSNNQQCIDPDFSLKLITIRNYFSGKNISKIYADDNALIIEKMDEHDQKIYFIEEYFDTETQSAEQIVIEIMDILEYYLRWNKLPARFVNQVNNLKMFIRHIMNFGLRYKTNEIKSLISAEWVSISALSRLNDHIILPDNFEAIKLFINEQLIIKSTSYFNEQKVYEKNKVNEEGLVFEEPELLNKIPLDRAITVLSFFLRYGYLPEDLHIADQYKKTIFFQEILKILYKNDPGKLRELLENKNGVEDAKIYLFELIINNKDATDLATHLKKSRKIFFENILLNSNWLIDIDFKHAGTLWEHVFKNRNSYKIALNALKSFSSASFAKFILENYPNTFFMKLVSYKLGLQDSENYFIESVFGFWNAVLKSNNERKKFIDTLYDYNVQFIAGKYLITGKKNYISSSLAYISFELNESASNIYRSVFNIISDKNNRIQNVDQKIVDLVRNELPAGMQLHEENMYRNAVEKKMESDSLGKVLRENVDQFRQRILKEMMQISGNNNTEMIPCDNIYIKNAGLVLFYPFLVTLLERVGLLENKQFKNEYTGNRAILLLQYLATGMEDFDEFDLVLNKIICGIPVSEAVSLSFNVTQGEKDITYELYEVFIQRWPQMKNTSIEGIRSSFIQRTGVLRISEEGWVLRVEQKAYDILLQTLPWAFGFIKTPMMEKILLVEWI